MEKPTNKQLLTWGNEDGHYNSFIRQIGHKYLSQAEQSKYILQRVITCIIWDDSGSFFGLSQLYVAGMNNGESFIKGARGSHQSLLERLKSEVESQEAPMSVIQPLKEVYEAIQFSDWTNKEQFYHDTNMWKAARNNIAAQIETDPVLKEAMTYKMPSRIEKRIDKEWEKFCNTNFIRQ